MAINPITLNGTITRIQDFTTQKQNEDNKGLTDHFNSQVRFEKEVDVKLTHVNKQDDTDQSKKKFDAREKGENEYSGDGGQKKKKKENNTEGKVVIKGENHFDIHI